MNAARPWRLLGTADLDAIAAGAGPLLQAWVDEWLPGATIAVHAVDAHADPLLHLQAGEHQLALKDGQETLRAVLFHGGGIIRALQAQAVADLGAAPAGDGLQAAATQYPLRDLLARLARLPAGSASRHGLYSQDQAVRPAPAKGCATVLLMLAVERDAMRVWLAHDLVADWCRRRPGHARPALTARMAALSGHRLSFQLQAGGAILALGDLLRLQPGDVIRLGAGLDQPMALLTENGDAFGRCYLGLQHGRPVIQFGI